MYRETHGTNKRYGYQKASSRLQTDYLNRYSLSRKRAFPKMVFPGIRKQDSQIEEKFLKNSYKSGEWCLERIDRSHKFVILYSGRITYCACDVFRCTMDTQCNVSVSH